MLFHILVEDQSGKVALETLIPKIINSDQHDFKVFAYKGIGKIPKNLNNQADPKKFFLLDQLPRVLRALGQTWVAHSKTNAAVFVICDLDDKCLKAFRAELLNLVNRIRHAPDTHFCIAIEEGEAWLLGDLDAVKRAYPKAKTKILDAYINDDICGTWELLADALFKGGNKALKKPGFWAVGHEKSKWATKICPHMQVDQNQSPSFQYFRDMLRRVAATEDN